MSCGGPGFTATRPGVNRWREIRPTANTSHWHWRLLSLNVQWDFFLFISSSFWHVDKMETDHQNYILKAPSSYWVDRLLYGASSDRAQSINRPFWCRELFFARHQTRFSLSRAVVIATHWLAERRDLSLDVVLASRDWVSESMWQWRRVICLIVFRGRQFLAPGILHQLSFILSGN